MLNGTETKTSLDIDGLVKIIRGEE